MKITSQELIIMLKNVCDIGDKAIDENTSFKSISLDSMDIAAYMLELEENYKIKISNNDILSLDSVKQIMDYILKQINKKS